MYGLNQEPRAWFQQVNNFLVGLTCSRADISLFLFHHGSCILYLLVYVDDLILIVNKLDTIHKFFSGLIKSFPLKILVGQVIFSASRLPMITLFCS